MRYFPVFLDATNINALVVGAGEVASRKCELLMKTSAKIQVIAPDACDTVLNYASENKLEYIQRAFKDDDLKDKNLVFVATDKSEINQYIHDLAEKENILVNVVDNTPLCKFITPSIVDRSPITIAMSSGGVAPVLLRFLRQKLESTIPGNISRLGKFSEKFRETVKQSLSSVTARRYFWEDVLEGDIAENVLQGNQQQAEQQLLDKLDQIKNKDNEIGQVYLVGAGPGDPDLLTFRALRLMQKADAVVYDRLVSSEILELVRRDAEKIYVGKAKNHHTMSQQDINQLLVTLANDGQRVVRLKGGDPFIFGRGGEEIEKLMEHGINFQVVPGITSASGASTYAGIPLTHRDYSQSVIFVTGHGHLHDQSIPIDWQALARSNQTIVFYMGLSSLNEIVGQLLKHELSDDTHIALIENATRSNQRVINGTLKNIIDLADKHSVKPPTLIIVGNVVSLHKKLNWFHT